MKNKDNQKWHKSAEWERLWQEKYFLLEEHKKLYGHLNVKEIYETWELTLKFKGLKKWISKQRSNAKKDKIKFHREQLLYELGFRFDPLLDYWLKQYELLKDYKNKFGTPVINYQKQKEYSALYRWSYEQRAHKNNLNSFQINKLSELGFNWKKQKERWYIYYEKLKEYKDKFGDCNVPQPHYSKTPSNDLTKLGRFVCFQRTQHNKGRLPDEYYIALLNIGFDFNPIPINREKFWEKNLEQLLQYKKEHGDCKVPDKWKVNKVLSAWVQKQRKMVNTMPIERRMILDEIGFVWEVFDNHFESMFERLKLFKEKYRHIKVNRSYDEQLFLWMNNIRLVKRGKHTGILTEERIKKLDELGFDWEPQETFWEEHFQELKEYKLKFGNFDFRPKHDFRRLIRWILAQRKFKENLSEEKKRKLNEIGFEW